MTTPSLLHRKAIITGAGRGIGAAIASTLAKAGAEVVIVSRNAHELDTVAATIAKAACRAHALVGDLSKEPERIAAEALEKLGTVDILVNNAAVQVFEPVRSMKISDFIDSVAVNLVAAFVLSRAVIPGMVERGGGWIVNIASDLATRSRHGGAAYCSTKRGLLALAEVLQLEHRTDGIRISTILPGITRTSWDGKSPDDPSKEGQLDPADIAEAVLWCCTRRDGARIDSLVIHPPVQDSI
jgi:NAD(P)-dependent dehydrogenase (short-subunit alcohol dehydrogenase family)